MGELSSKKTEGERRLPGGAEPGIPAVFLLDHDMANHPGSGADQPRDGESTEREQPENRIGFRLAARIAGSWYGDRRGERQEQKG